MLRVLNRHDWRVKSLLAHQGLRSPDFLGKGLFALTYQTDDLGRVVKLTTDRITVSYLGDYTAPEGVHVPCVFGDIDVVGRIDDVDVYRIEMERLLPLPRAGATRRLANRLVNRFPHASHLIDESAADDAFADLAPSLQDFLHQLAWFASNYQDVGLDLRGNLMARADGTLVFADPVCDMKLLNWLCRLSSEHHYKTSRVFYRARLH